MAAQPPVVVQEKLQVGVIGMDLAAAGLHGSKPP